jgi:predicted MFS family arabinose efflux permease
VAIFGWVALARRSSNPTGTLAIISVTAAAATFAVLGSGSEPSPLLWFGVAALGVSYSTWLVIVMGMIVADESETRARLAPGKTSGAVLLAFFIGMAIGPAVFAEATLRGGPGSALLVLAGLFLLGALVAAGQLMHERRTAGMPRALRRR